MKMQLPIIMLLLDETQGKQYETLYARSKNGGVRTYRIFVEDRDGFAVIRTVKQTTLGGKETTDVQFVDSGVNIGKSNETTYLEQAYLMADSQYRRLLDAGFTTTIPTGKYNTDAEGKIKPMLAVSFNEKKIKFPCIVQPKYDGVRCLITFEDGEVRIFSRKGKPYNIPHLKKWAEENVDLLPLDGELYNHKELTFQEIVSAVKRESEITPLIHYVVYDTPRDGNNKERISYLEKAFSDVGENAPVSLSISRVCNGMSEVWKMHDKFTSEGYEGAIIRNMDGHYEQGFRSNDLIKLKVFDDAEFRIVDVVEASGRDSGTAIFVCECGGGLFNVKPQGTREKRAKYFNNSEEIIGKIVTVQYQGLSDEGIPRFPSAITIRDYE